MRKKERQEKTAEIELCTDPFDCAGVQESLTCKKKPPSRKRDRILTPSFDGSMSETLDCHGAAEKAVEIISLLPICYLGNKKRMLLRIWNFLDDNKISYSSVFDAFAGSCVFSFYSLLTGKRVSTNDVMVYPSLLACSFLDRLSECPSDEELKILMGGEINPSNNTGFVRAHYLNVYFTPSECDFLDRFRSNIISLFGPTVYCGIGGDGGPRLVSLTGDSSPVPTEHMRKASFSLYLILTLLHQLCFTGGRFFKRQIIASVDYRLDHIRNKGEQIDSKPTKFMWLAEIRKFLDVISEVGSWKNGVDIHSEDIVSLLSGNRAPEADMVYLDPPYGGLSSDYGILYSVFEEYVWGCEASAIPYLGGAAARFKKPKGYKEQFEETLTLCRRFPVWLISYNQKSFASLDDIVGIVKKFRGKVDVSGSDIKYRYRKGTGNEKEFLILARQ